MINETTLLVARQSIKKVLLMFPGKSVTAYWLDGKYPLQYLQKQQKIAFGEKTTRQVGKNDLEAVNLIYCIRSNDYFSGQARAWAKELKKPFVYFTDDNFFITPEHYSLAQKQNVAAKIGRLSQMDAVVVVSPELLNIVRQYNSNVTFILPYQLFLEEIPPSKKTVPIIIGHMSTLYREKHLEFVMPALEKILNEYQDQVALEFIGHQPKELAGRTQVTHYPFLEDYMEFRRFFATRQWDIGIAPLQDSLATRSKTDNKFREFGAHQICGIYSNVKCYTDWITHQETGCIVENTEEAWYRALKRLIDDEALRTKIARNSYQYVKAHYEIGRYCNQLLSVFESLW
jgi:glycosyltransferase involved in cell wall biosynthesis